MRVIAVHMAAAVWGRSVVAQEDFQGLAEVLDEMEAIDHLYGLGRAPANAVRIPLGTAIFRRSPLA